ncbi:alpha/beta fold hydrolase [Aminobacter carboxidus]|uniref:Alpha/beta fold hydrolase n=1 Tax=Aminobacter carboxidus TaxID=376165 RepID=A0ABR9GR17_9HYPH|nr:alpha/beta fold hydrolase [Aminobacter carboxidus]MBE1206124.1 alpha/beta fold hydrolase [Aminobacter carboxidus]
MPTYKRGIDLPCYVEAGVGSPVVFLHSMAGSADSWWPQIETLRGTHRCVAWDMPGYGGSAAISETTPMAEMADLLAQFLREKLQVERAHLVGLSVGGMILQSFGARHPDMAASLTIMDSSPKFAFGSSMRPEEFIEPILAQLASGIAVHQFADGMVRAIMAPDTPEAIRAAGVGAMARARPEGLALCTRLIGGHDGLEDLPRIATPTLVLVGEKDGETPPSYSAEIAARIGGAEMQVIPGAGHLSNVENTAAVNTALTAFLNRHR